MLGNRFIYPHHSDGELGRDARLRRQMTAAEATVSVRWERLGATRRFLTKQGNRKNTLEISPTERDATADYPLRHL